MDYLNNKAIIDTLNKCAAECNHCSTACLAEQDVAMLTDCIKLDLDCAAICNLTATLLARDSVHGMHLLKECIEVCKACDEECRKHPHMEHCLACAAACRGCADVCEKAQGILSN